MNVLWNVGLLEDLHSGVNVLQIVFGRYPLRYEADGQNQNGHDRPEVALKERPHALFRLEEFEPFNEFREPYLHVLTLHADGYLPRECELISNGRKKGVFTFRVLRDKLPNDDQPQSVSRCAQMKLEFLQLGLFFLAGFVIEALTLADEGNTGRNVRFNLAWVTLRTVFDLTVGALLAAWITQQIHGIRLFPIFPLSNIAWAFPAAMLALILRDFFYYWFHRLQHSSRWLWAEHELHHSDEHMNVTTALRHHWLETPLESILVVMPTAMLFGQAKVTVLAYLLSRSAGFFIHLNSRINLGIAFGSPTYHRVHHSKAAEHMDKNFAAFFPLWDVIFGTYCRSPKIAPETGLASGESVYSIPYALVMPFVKWGEMLTRDFHPYKKTNI